MSGFISGFIVLTKRDWFIIMRIKEELTLRKAGGKYLLIDPGKDHIDLVYVHTMNVTAARLWDLLKGRDFTLATIEELLESNYRISRDLAERDARIFLAYLRENAFLESICIADEG